MGAELLKMLSPKLDKNLSFGSFELAKEYALNYNRNRDPEKDNVIAGYFTLETNGQDLPDDKEGEIRYFFTKAYIEYADILNSRLPFLNNEFEYTGIPCSLEDTSKYDAWLAMKMRPVIQKMNLRIECPLIKKYFITTGACLAAELINGVKITLVYHDMLNEWDQ